MRHFRCCQCVERDVVDPESYHGMDRASHEISARSGLTLAGVPCLTDERGWSSPATRPASQLCCRLARPNNKVAANVLLQFLPSTTYDLPVAHVVACHTPCRTTARTARQPPPHATTAVHDMRPLPLPALEPTIDNTRCWATGYH